MPTKTDRILGFLPRTFQKSPRPPVLYPVVDPFGQELQTAENSLSAVMLSHWVDFADKGASTIDDLAKIAALYGLAPRDDESVEEFRQHLKHYARTFLDGTTTVQGILRIAAEVLGLNIADAEADLDAWWNRDTIDLVTIEAQCDDAAQKVLAVTALRVTGTAPLPAQITGSVSLSGVSLPNPSALHLAIDGAKAVDVTLPSGTVTADGIASAINKAMGKTVAHVDGSVLVLASTTLGAGSKLEVLSGASDAAGLVLGLAPRVYQGASAVGATLAGTTDLSAGVNLSQKRYLRLVVDGAHVSEIDCADPSTPAATNLNHIRDAINSGIGINVASHDGRHLILQSPTQGFKSSIALQQATAQDALSLLIGSTAPVQTGRDAAPARVAGSKDLSKGIDLSMASNLQLTIDGVSRALNCAGLNPKVTQTLEIVTAINAAFGAAVASPAGTGIAVRSRVTGPTSTIVFGSTVSGDATELIFGIGPRLFFGADATAARIIGTPDLNPPSPPAKRAGVDLAAQYLLQLAVDGGTPITIDLRSQAPNFRAAEPDQVVTAINQAESSPIASTDGHHLILTSVTKGANSSLEIKPLEHPRHRFFVTRALVVDEAAEQVFGTVSAQAQGAPATTAEIVGTNDLSHGVDLRDASTLRISVDNLPPQEIDCAGPRPRATQLTDIVKGINAKLPATPASTDGQHLILTSPSSGSKSRIVIEPPTSSAASDALPQLGLAAANMRGADASRVSFTSLADLSAGVDLMANASINLEVDSVGHEINLAKGGPAHLSAAEIAALINVAFKATVCIVSGSRLVLSSPTKGAGSEIGFKKPPGPDATASVFGVSPERIYRGQDLLPASIQSSQVDLSKPVNLSVARKLRLSINGSDPIDVDCAAQAANPAACTLPEIVKSVNAVNPTNAPPFVLASASGDGKHLILTSPTSGFASTLHLQPIPAGDASQKLLGTLDPTEQGQDVGPAAITGSVSVTGSLDLSQRSLMRLAVNGGRPVDVDVAGPFPSATSLDEVVTAINHVFPNVASITPDDKLQLTAPAGFEESSIALLPLRYVEIVEYPPKPAPSFSASLHGGDQFKLDNTGAADSSVALCIEAASGAVDPTFTNLTAGTSVSLHTTLQAGEAACVSFDPDSGLSAQVLAANGTQRALPPEQIHAGSLSYSVIIPFAGQRRLARDSGGAAGLELNNPAAPNVVILRPRRELAGSTILVKVTAAAAATIMPIFDVEVAVAGGKIAAEVYKGVTIGQGSGDGSLTANINVGVTFKSFSRLVKAEEISKGSALALPRGLSQWSYTECDGPRYDEARFYDPEAVTSPDADVEYRYPGKFCEQVGVYNLSRYGQSGDQRADCPMPLYGAFPSPAASPVKVTANWQNYQPGSFVVNLPADLDERFGARFNQSFYASGQARSASQTIPAETYANAVAEPAGDPDNLVTLINAKPSVYVKASLVPDVPLGWTPARMPFRAPQPLTRNPGDDLARLYLTEEGLTGAIRLTALQPGALGDHISVSARLTGPAIYQVDIFFKGSRYENARQVVRGPLPALGADVGNPGPIGVLHAKAAGVLADVTRDRNSRIRDASSP